MANNNKLLLPCSCSCSVLVFDREKNPFDDDNSVYVGLFKSQFGWKLDFWERLRWAKEILFKGSIWTDNVILDEESVEKLRKFLKEK